jgi:hypothetical protein
MGVLVQGIRGALLFSGFCEEFEKSPEEKGMVTNEARTGSTDKKVRRWFQAARVSFTMGR